MRVWTRGSEAKLGLEAKGAILMASWRFDLAAASWDAPVVGSSWETGMVIEGKKDCHEESDDSD